MRGIFALASILLMAGTIGTATAEPRDSLGRESADALVVKWAPVMRKILGWNDGAIERFRQDFGSLPVPVLEEALRAQSWEEVNEARSRHQALAARESWAKAIPLNRIRAEDASNDQLVEAHKWLAKTVSPYYVEKEEYVFYPAAPCTVFDTRYATDPNAAGIVSDGVTRRFVIFTEGSLTSNFLAQGGNPSCSNPFYAGGGRPFAVMMTVYVSDATANGWLAFYREGDPDPSQATITVYYSPGPTRTQTVIALVHRAYDTGATYDVAVTGRYGSAHASASVTGYFVKRQSQPLDCMAGTVVSQALSTAGSTPFSVIATTCPDGYALVSTNCQATGDTSSNLTMSGSGVIASGQAHCSGFHSGTAAVTISNTPWCCRIPGRGKY